ncbi:MAG TPA: PAS domain-containing protein [Stenomitos sp.]
MNHDLQRSFPSDEGSSQKLQQDMAEAHDPSNADMANTPTRQSDLALDIPALQILDSSDDCIKVFDLSGRLLFMNRGGQALLGIEDITPFLNTSWTEFWQESEQQACSEAIARAAAGEVCSLEGYCPTLKGEPKWWDNKISPIRSTNGSVERLLCISRDITERKRAEHEHQQTEAALRASEAQFRLLTTANSNTVYKMSADWREMRLLEGKDFLASSSYPNQSWLEQYIPEAEQSRVMAAIAEAIRTKSPFELEHRVIQQDGAIGWAFSKAIPLLDQQGEIVEWLGAMSDVTVRRQTELNAECLALVTQNLTEATCVEDIIQTVGVQLNHYFQVSICAFVEIDESAGLATIDQSWHQANEASLVGVYRLSEFVTAEFFQAAKLGQAIIVRDVNADPNIVDPERFIPLKIGSFINVPLIRNGDWKFILGIYHQTPYNWRRDEIELMCELANRIWNKLERTRIEIALRQNQEIFSALVGNAPFGVCMIDSELRFQQANQTAIATLNVGPLIGRDLAEVLQIIWHEPFVTETLHHLRHTFATGEPYSSPSMTELRADIAEIQSYDWQIHRITLPDGSYGVVCYFYDLSEIKQAEEMMRRNGERDAFLVTLNDALRPLNNPAEILATINRVLGDQLKANRVTYFEVRGTDYFLEQNYVNGAKSLRGGYPIESFGAELLATYRRGHTAIATDVTNDPNLTTDQRAAYAETQIGAYIGVPLVKQGEFVAGLAVHSSHPRNWTPEEIALTEEVAERTGATVERAHAEVALRASEAKYRGLFESLDEGYFLADVIFDEHNHPIDIFYIEANPAATRMVGQDFTGRRLKEIDPNYEAYWYEIFGRVAQTGQSERLEQYAEPDRKWYDFYVFKVGDENSRRISVVFNDITERKRQEANLALLAEITEAFSELTTAQDIIQTIGAKLGAYLNLATCHLVEIDEVANQSHIYESWRVPEAPQLAGTYQISEFLTPELHRALREGETVAITDTQNSSWVKADAYAQIGIRGFVTVPFLRFGTWKYLLSVTTLQVRHWQDDEIELIQELSNRLFPRLERARAEALLQASHDTFHHLVNYSPFGIYTVDADFRIAQMSVVAQEAFANVRPLIGRDLSEALHILWPDPFASEAIAHFRHTLETGEPYHAPNRVERRLDLDEVKSYDWKLERITLPDGRFGVVCHFYDLSERLQFEAALRESEVRWTQRTGQIERDHKL